MAIVGSSPSAVGTIAAISSPEKYIATPAATLMAANIRIDQPNLTVYRDYNGVLHVAGITLGEDQVANQRHQADYQLAKSER